VTTTVATARERTFPTASVAVVEDDAAVRASLIRLLREAGFAASEYACAEDFLAAVDPDAQSCVLLDVRMPGMSGIAAHTELSRRAPLLPVIFVTAHGDVPMAVDAMRRGAFDFLEKPVRAGRLIESVREALTWQQDTREKRSEDGDVLGRFAKLTEREREVVRLVAEGRTNKGIAAELGVSSQAIDARRANAMAKLGVTTVAHLVRLVVAAEHLEAIPPS
jgi:two-component system response regulator FixJ